MVKVEMTPRVVQHLTDHMEDAIAALSIMAHRHREAAGLPLDAGALAPSPMCVHRSLVERGAEAIARPHDIVRRQLQLATNPQEHPQFLL